MSEKGERFINIILHLFLCELKQPEQVNLDYVFNNHLDKIWLDFTFFNKQTTKGQKRIK